MGVLRENSVFDLNCLGIGDQLCFSRLPEIYYKQYGKKMLFGGKDQWKIFRTNPYVTLVDRSNLAEHSVQTFDVHITNSKIYERSQTYIKTALWANNVDIHIRPYMNLDFSIVQKNKTIAICTEGSKITNPDRANIIPVDVINEIVKLLPGYTIYQVGGLADYKIEDYKIKGVIDKRGLSLVDTGNILLECEYFIGLNSGMYHLANCCPNIKSFIYTNHDMRRPFDLTAYPTSKWFYDDGATFYFFKEKFDEVHDVESMIDFIKKAVLLK